MQQQRGGTQQQGPDRTLPRAFLVPQTFGDLTPTADLLDLIQDEQRLPSSAQQSRQLPLGFDPLGRMGERRIGGSRVRRPSQAFPDLLGRCALAHLPGSHDHLEERHSGRKPPFDLGNGRSLEVHVTQLAGTEGVGQPYSIIE